MTYSLTNGMLVPEISTEIFGAAAKGSALAKLSPNKPKTTYGPQVQMVWNERPKAQIRTQGQQKGDGSGQLGTVTSDSFKVIVSQRLSDEFVKADAERQATLLRGVTEAAGEALAEQIDMSGFYGLSVLEGTRATAVTHFIDETAEVATLPAGPDYTKANATVWSAAGMVIENGYSPNGIALSNKLVGHLGAQVDSNGRSLFPEIALSGLGLSSFSGIPAAVSANVHGGRVKNDSKRLAFVGDFSSIQWGHVNGIEIETIEYGDPDGMGRDLKGFNEVVVRLETHLYLLISDINAFASVATP